MVATMIEEVVAKLTIECKIKKLEKHRELDIERT
jgi:hypothetical protein